MELYLAFIDEIGRTIDGNYLYRFDFTYEPDVVWGEYFYVAPSIIIPNLQPDENCINLTGRVELKTKLNLAKRNGCFSMQDCFEHIIALGFTDIDDDEEIVFNFGESYDEVVEKLKEKGYCLTDIVEKEIGKEEIIDNLIENIETIETEASKPIYAEIITLEKGKEYKMEELNQLLFDNGYERVEYVGRKCQHAIRGHIMDIFPLHFEYRNPFRISFFGDVIEDIYSFDIYTQKEIEHVEKITIYKNNI